MKKKLLLLISLVLSVSMILMACGEDKKDKESEKASGKNVEKTKELTPEEEEEAWKKEPAYGQTIKVGYNGGLCVASPAVALKKGFYEQNGIKAEIINAPEGRDALGIGKIDVFTSHIAQFLVPTVNGLNVTFTTAAQTGCKSLYVLKDSDINSTKDLIGKTVAIPDGVGASDHNIALRFFNHDNIDPSEITFKPVETSASILAMQNGEIQGVILSDQFAEKFMEDGTLKVIRSLTWDEDFKVEPCCIHGLNRDFVKENPITAKKITLSIKQASYWIEENKRDAAQLLFDNNWASGDFEQTVRMLESYDFKITDELTEEALISIINDYKEFGLIDSSLDTDKVLNTVWNPLIKGINVQETMK